MVNFGVLCKQIRLAVGIEAQAGLLVLREKMAEKAMA
jgi:hypothetical protein